MTLCTEGASAVRSCVVMQLVTQGEVRITPVRERENKSLEAMSQHAMERMKPKAKFSGRYLWITTAAVNNTALSLTPLNLDPRCIALTDNYQYYRFTKIKVTSWGSRSSTTAPIFLGFIPGITGVALSGGQQVLDCPVARWGTGQFGCPFPYFTVPKNVLRPVSSPWLRRGTANDDLLEVQGQLYLSGPTHTFDTNNVYVDVTWEIEVCAPVAATVSSTAPFVDQQLSQRLKELREQKVQQDEQEIVMLRSYEPPDRLEEIERALGMVSARIQSAKLSTPREEHTKKS